MAPGEQLNRAGSCCYALWGWGGWRPCRRWPWLWHCWGPGWGGWAWWPPPRGRSDCRAPTTGGWREQQTEIMFSDSLLFWIIGFSSDRCVSPQSDAGLPHHLRAQVFGGQFERRLHETQLLQKPVELSGAGQQQWAHLLQLDGQDESSGQQIFSPHWWWNTDDKQRKSYSRHSELPVPLVIGQHVSNLRHGLLYLPVGVDLVDKNKSDRNIMSRTSSCWNVG